MRVTRLLVVLFVLVLVGLVGLAGTASPLAHAGGAGDGALALTVTVNGSAPARRFATVRAGSWVVKRYRLVNRGEADLYRVRIAEPGVPGGRVACPRGPLGALRTAECVARFRALPGRHGGTARATGAIPSLRRTITASTRSGYEGVAGALALTETVRVVPPVGAGRAAALATATVRYTVTNLGNRPVHAVRLTDPALAARSAAPGDPVCTLPELAPGVSAGCVATVRRGPGRYRSAGLAAGSDRVTTLGERGERRPAPLLTARAEAAFQVAAPPVRARPRPVPTSGTAGTAGASGTAGTSGTPGTRPGPGTGRPGGPATGAPGAPAPALALAPAPGGALLAAGVFGAAPPALGPVPPEEAVPEGALPPGAVAPQQPRAAERPDQTERSGRTTGNPTTHPRAAVADDEDLLGRLHRRGRELPHLGMTVMLLLILVPAALAAALLGNRRR